MILTLTCLLHIMVFIFLASTQYLNTAKLKLIYVFLMLLSSSGYHNNDFINSTYIMSLIATTCLNFSWVNTISSIFICFSTSKLVMLYVFSVYIPHNFLSISIQKLNLTFIELKTIHLYIGYTINLIFGARYLITNSNEWSSWLLINLFSLYQAYMLKQCIERSKEKQYIKEIKLKKTSKTNGFVVKQ